jgi:hypothetical protein
VLALILTFSTLVARLMGGGARLAGGTAENIGILFTLVAAILDLGVLAGTNRKDAGEMDDWLAPRNYRCRRAGNWPRVAAPFCRLSHFIFIFGLGFLLAIVNPTGRALHDLIAGTVVVREYGGKGSMTKRQTTRV